MLERHRRELQRGRRFRGLNFRPGRHRHPASGQDIARGRALAQPRHEHDVPQRRQTGDDLAEHRGAVMQFAAVAVAVHRDQHGWLDLRETFQHAARGKLRRTA